MDDNVDGRRVVHARRRLCSARARVTFAVALAAGLATAAVALAGVASAAAVNLTGTWQSVRHCVIGGCAGKDLTDTFTLTQAPGSNTVTGTGQHGATVSGTLTGSTFAVTATSAGYVATASVVISADGLSWSGSYQDNKGASGTFTATREGTTPTGELRPSATQVICNLQVAFSNFTCTAQVGDASEQSPPKVPTGSVRFTAPKGAFEPTEACRLLATPGSGSVSSCSVTYVPPFEGIPTGTAAPVTAVYSGDTVFATSTGRPGAGAGVSPTASPATVGPGEATTTVSCPAGAQSCPITVNLSVVQQGEQVVAARKAKRRTVTIGGTAVTLRAGQRRTITVTLNRVGRKLLAAHKHLLALLQINSRGVAIRTQKIQIKPPRKGG